MLTEALRVVLTFIMKNHVYKFDGTVRKQANGGAIGLELTGGLAQIFMVWWDREFKARVERLGIPLYMYKRYVDDINVIVGAVEPGAKIARKNVIMNGKDCPVNVVLHEFYAKEVLSKMMLSSRSALPVKVKRTVLTQEVLRVLLNCNPEIPWERTVGHVNNMMRRMQYSGYSKGFRYEIVQSALHAYRKIQELDQTGVKPMYRPKEWRQNERRKEKEEKRRSWYRKGNYSSVIFVPATPESSLKRSLDEDVKKSGLRIRIVEKSGMRVKKVLQRSDPFKKRTCERECCFVCRTGGRGPCDSFGVTYEIKCQTCEQKYVGETARSAFTRGKEHLDGMDRGVSQSVLRRHANDCHNGVIPDYVMNVTGVYHGDAMLRQITESIKIRREGSINNKTEWNSL